MSGDPAPLHLGGPVPSHSSGPGPRRGRSRWRADALPLALDAVAEGTWLTVVYLSIQVLLGRQPAYLGPVELTLCAAAGIVAARALPEVAPRAVAVVATGAAALGWLIAGPARTELWALDPAGFLAAHPGGWVAGLAVVRGAAHADRQADDLVVGGLLSWGLPVLALPWLLAQVTPEPWRAEFEDTGFAATLGFVVAALLAVAVARLDALGAASGVDWRTNRSWLTLLAALVGLMVAVGVPLAGVVGIPLDAALRGALGPVWVVAAAVATVIALPLGLVLGGFLTLLLAIIPKAKDVVQPVQEQVGRQFTDYTATGAGTVAAIGAIVLVTALILLLVAIALRLLPGRPPGPREEGEERTILVPAGAIRLRVPVPHPRLPRREPPPRDAAGAYVAAIDVLRADPAVARAGHETPAAHARRLRASDRGILPLDLLAADYQLARYAGRTLSRAENRRGIGRWRWIRDHAGGHGADETGSGLR